MTINQTRKNHPNPGSLLRYLRIAKDSTLAELGSLVGLPTMTISNMERGIFGSYLTVKKVADFFHISVDSLVRDNYEDVAKIISAPIKPGKKQRDQRRKNQHLKDDQGDYAEALVAEYERERLRGTVYENLINASYADDASAGFDIMSFDGGKPMYIEVKSTNKKNGEEPFFLTANELAFARHCKKTGLNYKIFRVFVLNRRKNKWALAVWDVDDVLSFHYEVDTYRVTPVGKEFPA